MDWAVSFVGLVVGGLIGMTGMGAGSLTAPMLILWFGVPPLEAVGSALVYSAVTKSIGALEHVRLRTVDFTAVAWMAAASVPVSILTVWLVARFGAFAPGVDQLILHALGIVLIVAGLGLLARSLFHRAIPGESAARRPWLLGVGGAVLGGMVGMTAAGSGTLGTVLLSLTTRLDARRVVGTVIVHAMILTFAGAFVHLAFGTVRLALAASLLIGAIPGVVLGSRITIRMPDAALRVVMATFLIAIGVHFEIMAADRSVVAAAPGREPSEVVSHSTQRYRNVRFAHPTILNWSRP